MNKEQFEGRRVGCLFVYLFGSEIVSVVHHSGEGLTAGLITFSAIPTLDCATQSGADLHTSANPI